MAELVTHVLAYKNEKNRCYTILDIGCNDGSLLNLFKEGIDCLTIGVDPTDAILEVQASVDVTYQQFFTLETASEIKSKYGYPDVITFTNVFAHIEDFEGLLNALIELIGPETLVVIENHYLGSIIESKQFDSFYHEHPRTYSVNSFVVIAEKLGLNINHVEFPSRYGGNIRVTLSKELGTFENLDQLLNSELNIPIKFELLQKSYEQWILDSKITVQELSSRGPFIGKSLPARAVMLITSLGLTEKDMPFVFEKPGSPKIGSYVPGTRIEIRSDDELLDFNSYPIVLWAWHISTEIRSYLKDKKYLGAVFTPLPVFKKLL
jgi:SAM-dependent methyltransferase